MRRQADSPKLYLHVGPPKTATTALQYELQSGDRSYDYFGVSQPRGNKELEDSEVLHNAVAGQHQNLDQVDSVLVRINDAFVAGRNVVISEEMFLVDGIVSHQTKLRRLSTILQGIPVVVAICLRNPADALPSLYQERYDRLPLRQRLSFGAFTRSNQAKIFDYQHLLSLLQINFSDVITLSFDKLVGGSASLKDIFGAGFPGKRCVNLQMLNAGTQGVRGRKMPATRVEHMVGKSRLMPPSVRDRLRRLTFVRVLWERLAHLEIQSRKERSLVLPAKLAEDLHQKWLEVIDGKS